MGLLAGIVGVGAVMIAQGVAQRVVAGSAAEVLDVLVLVKRGDALCGQLAADPIRLLQQMHPASAPGGGERCGHAACAAANDKDIALDLTGRFQSACADDGNAGITIDWHPHDVDEFIENVLHHRLFSAPSFSAARARSAGMPSPSPAR